MNDVEVKLREVENELVELLEPYYCKNDEAHAFTHVKSVLSLCYRICITLEVNDFRNILMLTYAAYFHDMFSSINRDNHHTMAHDFILSSNEPILEKLTVGELSFVAKAVLEHRASYTGKFTSIISEILSAADRGVPDLVGLVKRIHMCSIDKNAVFKLPVIKDVIENGEELTPELSLKRTFLHLKDKFGTKGYARYNDVYLRVFADDLRAMQEKIDNITMTDIKAIVNGDDTNVKMYIGTGVPGKETYQ